MIEARLQSLILAQLQQRGVFCWRANTGTARTAHGFVRFNIPGCSDIVGVLPPTGRMLCVEVKSDRGRQTPEQKLFEQRVSDAGGLYVLARTLDDVLGAIAC